MKRSITYDLKVDDIANGLAGKNYDGSLYEATCGEGSHAEVKSVKSIDGSDMPMCKNCQHTFIEYMKLIIGE